MPLEAVVLLTQVATLISILAFGAKFARFLHRMEFKVDLMWNDYEAGRQQYKDWTERRAMDRDAGP